MGDAPPDRSTQQRKDALSRANNVRSLRAKLKADLKAGRIDLISVLENPPKEAQTMKIINVLIAAPGMGRVKANRIVTKSRVSPSKLINGLSVRQRDEIISYLKRR